MANLLAGLIGALVGLGGVAIGAWLQGLKEHQAGYAIKNSAQQSATSALRGKSTTGVVTPLTSTQPWKKRRWHEHKMHGPRFICSATQTPFR